MREVLESRPIRDLTSPERITKGQRVVLVIEAVCISDEERPRKGGPLDDDLEHVATLEFDRTRLVAIKAEVE